MNVYPETELRKQADGPTKKMLDLWQSLCSQIVGTTIEITVCDRREYPFYGIDTFKGQLNTALPQTFGDRVVLVLLLDKVKPIDMLIATHELGHWVLKLQGLKSVSNKNDPSGQIEIRLNSLGSHSALYILQKKIGHDPQKEIDKRAAHNTAVLTKSAEIIDEMMLTQSALMYADDLINCSHSHHVGLQRVLSRKHPRTEGLVNKILEIKNSTDISKVELVSPFCQEIIKNLGLGPNWTVENEVSRLKEHVKSLSS